MHTGSCFRGKIPEDGAESMLVVDALTNLFFLFFVRQNGLPLGLQQRSVVLLHFYTSRCLLLSLLVSFVFLYRLFDPFLQVAFLSFLLAFSLLVAIRVINIILFFAPAGVDMRRATRSGP